jgi:hypothetical protein
VSGGGAQFHTLDPARILDSRIPTGVPSVFNGTTVQTLMVRGHGSVPSGAIAVTANLTVTAQQAKGSVAAGPTVSPSTPFSNINFPVGDNRANGLTVTLSALGSIELVYLPTSRVSAHVILDVCGYYQ